MVCQQIRAAMINRLVNGVHVYTVSVKMFSLNFCGGLIHSIIFLITQFHTDSFFSPFLSESG